MDVQVKVKGRCAKKEVGGLSVTSAIVEHNRKSVFRGKKGKEHSSDLIGSEDRDQLEENAEKFDPFNRRREVKHTFKDRPSRGPFDGLSLDTIERFIENRKREYMQKYL